MKTKVFQILTIATLSLGLTGCFSGRTSVVATQYASRPYDLYLNGNLVCKLGSDDDCTFQTRGTTAGGQLEAYLDGQSVGAIEVHRGISFASILWIPLTYGMSLFLYKAYPDEIEIPIDSYVLRSGYRSDNGDSFGSGSVWDRPYSSTKKVKKTVKQVETAPIDSDEPRAVRGQDATPEEPVNEESAPAKSVWD